MYWNEYKTKSENKNTANQYRYCLESNFVGVNRLFVLIYRNQNDNVKRFNAKKYYLRRGIIKNCNISGENFQDLPTDFDMKQFEEIRKLITG